MQILDKYTQKQNIFCSAIFKGKTQIKKIVPTVAAGTSVIVAANVNDLFNKSVDEDKKIEEYLLNAIQTQERISKQKMADDLGIDFNTCRHKTEKGKPLYELWKQTNYRKNKIEKSEKAIVDNNERSNIKSELYKIISDAYVNNTPINYLQISEKLGISYSACKQRIRSDKTLFDMWKHIEHPKLTEKSQQINLQIEEFIQEAIEKRKPINNQLIADKLGLTKDVVRWRMDKNPQIKSMMAQAIYSKYTEKSQEINQKIAEILRQTISDKIRVRLEDIAKKVGLSRCGVQDRLRNSSELTDLWAKTPHLKRNSEKQQKTLIVEEQLKQFMEHCIKENKQVKLKELAEETGVSYDYCTKIISHNAELKELWQRTPKKPVQNGSQGYILQENEKLISIIEKHIIQGNQVSGKQLAKEAGLTLAVLQQRIIRFPNIGLMWKKLKDLDKQVSNDVNKKIENVLKEAVKNKTILSNKKLAKQVGIAKQTCAARISENKYLSELWSQVETNGNYHLTEKQNQLKTILEKAIADNITITRPEIAKKMGISTHICYKLLYSTPEIQTLWEQIESIRLESKSRDIVKDITDVLNSANTNLQKLNINDIAEILQTTDGIVKDKLTRYPKLNELWEKNKKLNDIILKQIHSLKQNKISENDIQRKLGLEDSIFEKYITKYNDILTIAATRKDENISEKEYMDWALLSQREYELVTHKIFEKMGYKTTVTRYKSDGGIDVFAEKDGKSTIIECIQNIKSEERAKEVLALEGLREANNIDEAILVTVSGIYNNAADCVSAINNNSARFKVLDLEKLIKLAKKHNIDISSVNLNGFEEKNETMLDSGVYTNWYFKKSDKISDSEREKWLKLTQSNYEEKIISYYQKNGYETKSLFPKIGIKGLYALEKDGKKIIINCGSRNAIPNIDDIRGLYGSKNVFNADEVVFVGISGLTAPEKVFIDFINNQDDKKETFKIISFDKLIEFAKE